MNNGQDILPDGDGTTGCAGSSKPEVVTPLQPPTTETGRDIETRIRAMSRIELITIWQRRWKRAPPKGLSRRLLAYNAAWQTQSEQHGGWSAATRRRLAALARQDGHRGVDTKDSQVSVPALGSARHRALRPGTRLVRQWGGQTHVVEVVERGFTWQGDYFRSLTAIARVITAAHWSGPRFFGLRSTDEPGRRTEARRVNTQRRYALGEHPDV